MSWGPCFMYYRCPVCGKKYKYAVDMIPVFADRFGACPQCGSAGVLIGDGARRTDDNCYPEVED